MFQKVFKNICMLSIILQLLPLNAQCLPTSLLVKIKPLMSYGQSEQIPALSELHYLFFHAKVWIEIVHF